MNATNKYYATWAIGWALGETQKKAIIRAISNDPDTAKRVIREKGSLYIWTCKCSEDFNYIKSFSPQCKKSETKHMYVTKINKNDIFMIEGVM